MSEKQISNGFKPSIKYFFHKAISQISIGIKKKFTVLIIFTFQKNNLLEFKAKFHV